MTRPHDSRRLRLFLLAVLLTLLAVLVSHQLIYKLLVVPRLAGWHAIPFFWLLLLFAPMIAATVLVGMKISAISEFLTVVVASAVVTELSFFVLSTLNEPGFHQQAAEAGLLLTIRFAILLAAFAFVFALIWAVSSFVRMRQQRRAAAAPNKPKHDARSLENE